MSYVVLARKWRPMRFEDLVGQDHVSRTLANAIKSGRVAHAFLFTGVRGVGKTTSARILAKALNCMRAPGSVPAGVDPGPTATPCLVCPACVEIAQGTDVDVREIDGASYNGVDEVRKLQDSLPYRPARDRYKIFVVDEVHMLSQSAWNAFLKTLEEPPPHVKFIFATTEVHKVPITILSRVQRFDFKLIGTQLIAERLRYVLSEEKISADDESVAVIAREAAGSMRDAMSLLDQVIAWGGERLSGQDVARVLGVASHQVLHDVASALVTGDAARCLTIVSELSNQGFDIAHVARDLLLVLRDLVVAKVCKEPAELLDLADAERHDVLELAKKSDPDDLIRLHQGFSQAYDEVMKSGQPRAALEMLLVRLARRPPLLPLDDLVGRLAALERRLGGTPARSGAAPARAPVAAAPPLENRAPPPLQAVRPRAREQQTTPERGAPSRDPRDEPRAPSRSDELAAPSDSPPEGRRPQTGPSDSPPEGRRPQTGPSDSPPEGRRPQTGPSDSPPEGRRPQTGPSPTRDAAAELEDFRKIVDRIREDRPELAAFLEHAAPLEVNATQILLGWEKGSIFAEQASTKESILLLTRAASEHFRATPRVTFDLDSARAKTTTTVAAIDAEARQEQARQAVAQARRHPRVADAIEILGARLKDVKLGD